jgi:hypothetical protein
MTGGTHQSAHEIKDDTGTATSQPGGRLLRHQRGAIDAAVTTVTWLSKNPEFVVRAYASVGVRGPAGAALTGRVDACKDAGTKNGRPAVLGAKEPSPACDTMKPQ